MRLFGFTSDKILIAIDGSRHSDNVVREGIRLAKVTKAAVLLLYVVPEYVIASDEFPVPKAATRGPRVGEVADRVVSRAQEMIAAEGLECEAFSEFGNPTSRILSVAKSKKVDMIVVGIHGLHRLGLVRSLGSVARRVIENSGVPVLVVP